MAYSKVIFNGTTLMDVTSDTVDAANLLTGYTATKNDGTQVVGTYQGGGGAPQTDPTIESGVIFIDYDGSIIEEWEASTVSGKTALPSNPSHTGLMAQGWNYELANIKSYISAYPYALLAVGQMYITSSGKTEIDVEITGDTLHPYLGIAVNGTVVVDWGDSSSTSTLTGTSLTTLQWADHVYTAGNYTISITVSSGSFCFYTSNSAYGGVLSYTNSFTYSKMYASCVTAIRFGTGARLGQYAFTNMYRLRYVTMPPSVATTIDSYYFNNNYGAPSIIIPTGISIIAGNAMQYCYGAKYISLPNGITSIGSSAFLQCTSLKAISFPTTATTISQSACSGCGNLQDLPLPSIATISTNSFYNCYSLRKVTIPSSVTTIQATAFSTCRSLHKIRFERTTPPTVSASSAWTNLGTYCTISVPVGSKSAYTSASNYPSSSSYTYIEEA